MNKLWDLFPTVSSLVIFISYMVFSVGQGILVKAANGNNKSYAFNTVIVVLLTEVMKLILSYICYIKDYSLSSMWHCFRSNIKIFYIYLVPSFLYCIYNNLTFVNLSHFDPTCYFILLQSKVVVTGITFQLVFNKRLTKIQWLSLVLLTFGCVIQQVDWDHIKFLFFGSESPQKEFSFFSIYLFLILIQTLCSCAAGVYNEYLLKNAGANVNLFIQNIFMCVNSIFWNLVVLCFQGNLLSTFSAESFRPIFEPVVIAVILNNALIGISTSLFLGTLNSILKTFASAIELSFTAVLTWIIFKIEIKMNTILAIVIVTYSLYVYSQNPVRSQGKTEVVRTKEKDEVSLLEDV